ncbi:MAG TPA: hypothetical protein VGC57_00870 [Cellulomonas sp.]
MHEDLPRIASLDATTLGRARIVVMHSPESVADEPLPGDGPLGAPSGWQPGLGLRSLGEPGDLAPAFRWTLTLTDVQGVALAREHVTVPDCPTPLGDVVRLHLDLVGLRVEGDWVTDLGRDDLPRHAARVARGDDPR